MSENTQIAPSSALQSLQRLVGKWDISGSTIHGQVSYEWMEGHFFLCQHFDLVHDGRQIKGIEIIGHHREFGAEKASEDLKAHVFDNTGNTLDYVYELESDTLIIWGGVKGSPSYFKGTFAADGNSLTGAWIWPGGGYESNMTRVK
jgi:hypothetical protein